ncbi:MAG TPA: F0F1 ATP synthase subunit alpha [Candidatus Binataceae bacterium]|jgi:F-type H+-transporting ATPase subunit alpha
MATLLESLDHWLEAAPKRLSRVTPRPVAETFGRVENVGDGIAWLSGLPETRLDEILVFAGGIRGMAVDLSADRVGCFLLGRGVEVAAGSRVRGTGTVVRVPIGEALLGRTVDPLGNPMDDGAAIEAERMDPIDRPAPGIIDRDLVTQPLYTGLMVIDAMFPIGRGQRELIIGDRSTGKSAIGVDTIINQRRSDVISVYVAVGQRSSAVRQAIDAVRTYGAMQRCIFVVAHADAAPGLQWLAPYAGMTIAEYFRDRGGHALVVIDDLTKHAAVHRELALLLRQAPGREAYPGDIFHIHARLLERAAKLSEQLGGGSLTALPIAQTQSGNLSAYIPTNLISITDGQICLDSKLFYAGHHPAVDVGKSVSRVGGKTQVGAMRTLAEPLRLAYAQFLELELFARFGTMMDERTRRAIEHGQRLRVMLRQVQYSPRPMEIQVAQLLALQEEITDGIALEQVAPFAARLPEWLAAHAPEAIARLVRSGEMDQSTRAALTDAIRSLATQISGPNHPAT